MGKRHSHIAAGARIFTVFFILLFLLLFCRLVYIQVTKQVEGQMLTAMAEEKWTKERTLEATRGSIYDRNGNEIAKDVPSYTVFAIIDENFSKNSAKPMHVVDPKTTAQQLAPILQMDSAEIERILTTSNAFQVEFGSAGRNITQNQKEEIESLELPGIGFMKNMKRYYPNGTFASHVIGYMQLDEKGELHGQMGIERELEDVMKGKDGKYQYQTDRHGFRLPDPNEVITPPVDGNHVYLTIDSVIQTFLETALSDVQKEYEPEKIMAIVANPKTGEILAMGSRPSFDPNIRDIEYYVNDNISYPFEPGSTMKIFTLAAAVNDGVFNPYDTFMSGSYRMAPNIQAIRDHNAGRGWGKITYLEGIQRSSNVVVAKMVNENLGTDRFLDYLHAFGFDQPTNIDLPNEVPGKLLYRYPLEKITTSFGQGTIITPIQQIKAATAIANNGKMMRPYVIDKIVDPNTGEVVKQTEPIVDGEPITAEAAKEVRDILETVITAPEGTGKRYAIEGYSIAGKTGTAQIPDPKTGRYMSGHGNNIFSFIGMAPKDDPQLLMYVAVSKPKLEPTQVGSEAVSHIFKTVMNSSLHYLKIAPDEKEEESKRQAKDSLILDQYIGKNVEEVKNELEQKGLEVYVFGAEQKIIKQFPYANTEVLEGEKILLQTEGAMVMPDITGWSLRDVMKLTSFIEFKPNIMGNGYVIAQTPEPNSIITKGDYLVVELKTPAAKQMQAEDEQHEESDQATDEELININIRE